MPIIAIKKINSVARKSNKNNDDVIWISLFYHNIFVLISQLENATGGDIESRGSGTFTFQSL